MYVENMREAGHKDPKHHNTTAPRDRQGETRKAKGFYHPRKVRAAHHKP